MRDKICAELLFTTHPLTTESGLDDNRDTSTIRYLVTDFSVRSEEQPVPGGDIDRGRISQLLVSEKNSPTELGLIAEFGPADDRTVELLEAGRQLLATLDAQVGRQQELTVAVSDTGTSDQQCRVTPHIREEGGDGSAAKPATLPSSKRRSRAKQTL
jgi:hypothetical protein